MIKLEKFQARKTEPFLKWCILNNQVPSISIPLFKPDSSDPENKPANIAAQDAKKHKPHSIKHKFIKRLCKEYNYVADSRLCQRSITWKCQEQHNCLGRWFEPQGSFLREKL